MPLTHPRWIRWVAAISLAAMTCAGPAAQAPPAGPGAGGRGAMAQKIDDNTYAIGQMRIDVRRRELTVPARVNDTSTLEFVANTRGGAKAYESAITVEASAVAFNTALLLLGLDPARARVPEFQFDPNPPKGDPVEIRVALASGRAVPIEELILDTRTDKTLPPGPWVYTGSTFIDGGGQRKFLAELDGVLIGLMHGPQALIDNPRSDAVGGFGYMVLNPKLGLKPDAPATLTVRALDRDTKR